MNANELTTWSMSVDEVKALIETNRQQQVDLKIADDYSYILERKLKEAQAEIEALKEQIKEKDVCLKILMQRLDDGN